MIDKNKQYKTRDGREVRIYATDGCDDWPIHGAISNPYGWASYRWTKAGKGDVRESVILAADLIEVKPRIKRTLWMNLYLNHVGTPHRSRSDADGAADTSRVACVKVEIDVEEGHFDE